MKSSKYHSRINTIHLILLEPPLLHFFMYLVILSRIKLGSSSIFIVISLTNFSLNNFSFFLFKFHHLIFGLIILCFALLYIFICMSAIIILCCEVKLSSGITLQFLHAILSTFLVKKKSI